MSFNTFTQKYRLRNPYRPDEQVVQVVSISDQPQYDYSDCSWVSIDTEYLGLSFANSKLCLIQIASPDPENTELQRVELIWTWAHLFAPETDAAIAVKKFLADLLTRPDLEIIMHVSSADLPRIEKFAGVKVKAKVFDTKVAGKITLSETDDHSMANLITSLVDPKFVKDRAKTSSLWDTDPHGWDDKTIQYAFNDVLYLSPLKDSLKTIAARRGNLDLVNEAMGALPLISHLYAVGLSENVLRF